jgi:pSer/pThr/pTyr-binding forkhead associated (FHA) protein
MTDFANASLEFVIWLMRLALVGLIYLFVWRVFRAMIHGDQNKSSLVGTDTFLILQQPGTTLLPRNKVFELYDSTTIGRSSDCTIVLNDLLISDRHCQITRSENVWRIRDLGSTNKTYINGLQIVSQATIEDGDIISLGRVELRMKYVSKDNDE